MTLHEIHVTINDEPEQVDVPANMTLLRMLREKLALTGTKNGCAAGECGACTVLLNGEPVNSCMVLAVECDGARIVTVEGLASDEQLDPIQQTILIDAGRRAVRLLHPGHPDLGARAAGSQSGPDRGRDPRGAGGQSVPLHGILRIIESVKEAARMQSAAG